jgi:RNA polymerase sigma-70 factor (ECF subfamily)
MARLYRTRGDFLLTSGESIRLWLVADWSSERKLAAAGPEPLIATARTTPPVTPPSFDMLEEHVGTLYRYALRLAGQQDAAEDLTQETLLRAWRGRHQLRDAELLRVWLLRIATNLWTDQVRRGKSIPRALESEPPCPRPAPSTIINKREQVKLALAAMDELPPRQRQVLYLVTCEGLSHEEVATIAGVSAASVKANLSLARKEMRRRLSEVYREVCGRHACRETP